ncbi:hypothetical protein [Microcoleus sp.]|uniref:hypothetical protein n=1 Tax=Microcoleus sp. TaxID=44472 RepID=UPI003593A1B9
MRSATGIDITAVNYPSPSGVPPEVWACIWTPPQFRESRENLSFSFTARHIRGC